MTVASSVSAAAPANALPWPLALCSIKANPAARTTVDIVRNVSVTAARAARLESPFRFFIVVSPCVGSEHPAACTPVGCLRRGRASMREILDAGSKRHEERCVAAKRHAETLHKETPTPNFDSVISPDQSLWRRKESPPATTKTKTVA